MKELERKFYKQEKILQKKQRLEMKQKRAKDNMPNITRQPLNRAKTDLFLQVKSIMRVDFFPKIKFITNQENLMNLRNLDL